jgi:hypothetical protein
VTQSRRSASRSLQQGGASINCELRLTVEDNEHFFTMIVKVRSDATTRWNDAPVQEEQICAKIELCDV